jgi:type I restriction enzyme, R subunit
MKGHGLMQAIARVNRVFRDKPAGLVVDYIGIAQNLKSALGQYSSGDREQVGIDEADAVRVLLEKYEIVRAMFRPDTKGGFDYRPALDAAAKPQARLAIMAGAIDWVLTFQQDAAARPIATRCFTRGLRGTNLIRPQIIVSPLLTKIPKNVLNRG